VRLAQGLAKLMQLIASLSASRLLVGRPDELCLLGVSYGLEAFNHRSGKLLGGQT
jgi:hypothetical protein